MTPLRALVTAGGTREPIDDVRVVTNLSRGRFGAAIARALAARGVEVTLLASRDLIESRVDLSGLTVVEFSSFHDLAAALDRTVGAAPPDLLFMAAAVSDFSPVPQPGKVRSDQDEWVVRLRRNPKLLGSLREKCGVATFLVGFKLLSGSTPAELVRAAQEQVRRDRLNLTVANDLSRLNERDHPILLITPEGGALPVEGARADVAHQLVEFCLRRSQVRWAHTEFSCGVPPAEDTRAVAATLLSLAQTGGLLPGLEGNVSARARNGALWTTPRQVDKSTLTADALVLVRPDSQFRSLHSVGSHTSSIDAAVHAWLYDRLPGIDALLHMHDALVLPEAVTTFPYPCGTIEEAEEIHRALLQAAATGAWSGSGFGVELVRHGWLIGLEPNGVDRLRREWTEVASAHDAHLRDIGSIDASALIRTPIFAGARIVGISARHRHEGFRTVFLRPEHRGGGLGERLLAELERRPELIAVHDRCEAAGWFFERGWRRVGRDGPLQRLEPPTRRTDLVPIASVCLVDLLHGEVLLARRKKDPWRDHWTFPGGRVQPGETALAAAARELQEATGLVLPTSLPATQHTVYLGQEDGQRAFAVTCFVFHTLSRPTPVTTREIQSEWMPVQEAPRRRPLAPGTRRVLAGVRHTTGLPRPSP